MKPTIYFSPQNLLGLADSQGGCDGDGACASLGTRTQSPDSKNTIPQYLCQASPTQTTLFEPGYWLINSVGAAISWTVVNEPARQVFDFFASPRLLDDWPASAEISFEEFRQAASLFYQAGFLTDAQTNEMTWPTPSMRHPLESWLFLTRACNMACAHCFVSKDPRQMSLETGLQAVERLFQLAEQHGHPGVKIKYAGGEPTLRWDLVTALHERASILSQQSELPLIEILVTNGAALSRSRLDYLKSENINLSLSLDGFGEGHDRQRPFVNGQPSFERIFRSLEMALTMGLRPYLTITLTSLNLDDLPALTEFALKNHLSINWNFYRPHFSGDPLVPKHPGLITALQKGLKVIEENLPDYPFLDRLIDRSNFGMAHEHVCGAGRNYLSVDYDGRVLPCHMLSGANQVGIPLRILSKTHFDDFENPAVDEREGCRTCEWRYWCAGGCPILAGQSNGHEATQSPYCQVYKAVYPELARLKGLQILALNS